MIKTHLLGLQVKRGQTTCSETHQSGSQQTAV